MRLIRLLLVPAILLAAAAAWAGPVDINHADAATLTRELSGIGQKRAQAIVAERSAHGRYKDADDLQRRVASMGPKTIAKNRANLRFSP